MCNLFKDLSNICSQDAQKLHKNLHNHGEVLVMCIFFGNTGLILLCIFIIVDDEEAN